MSNFDKEMEDAITREEADKAKVSLETKYKAVEFIKTTLSGNEAQFRKLMEEKGPNWAGEYHFGGGMVMRNRLRGAGFSEKDLGIDNLDNVYIEWVEIAIMGKPLTHKYNDN